MSKADFDAWNAWSPFGGHPPPNEYFEDLYMAEIQEAAKVDQITERMNGGAVNGDIPKTLHVNPWYRLDFGGYKVLDKPMHCTGRRLRILVTGAGAAGIQVAYKLGNLPGIDLVGYERNIDVGGTWLVNKYPGCACDIPLHCYQFYWNRNPDWSSFYSPASEILKYLQDTTDKFDLRRFMKFNYKVLGCTWHEDEGKWQCRIQQPDSTEFVEEVDILFNTAGGLSQYKWPTIPGFDSFKGKLIHSAAWDDNYPLDGKTVAVIGSGSSAVQVVPNIQPVVKKLFNFVRSPVWLTPGFSARYAGPNGSNFKYSEEQKAKFRQDPAEYEKYIRMIEEDLGSRFKMQHSDSEEQRVALKNMQALMKARVGGGQDNMEWLMPKFDVSCRRLSPGDEYMQSFGKENVQLVKSSATAFTEDGVVDDAGREYKVNAIICATGFDVTFAPAFSVQGRNGVNLKTFYGNFARSYNGIMTPYFPNFFQFPGPGSPGSHGGVFAVIEWQIRWTRKVLEKMQREYQMDGADHRRGN